MSIMAHSCFSLLVLAVVAAIAMFVQGSLLRQMNNDDTIYDPLFPPVVQETILEAKVILSQQQGQQVDNWWNNYKPVVTATNNDMDIIGKAFITSYNNVHWRADHIISGSHVIESKAEDIGHSW
jgi:hypothetical protein